MKMYKIYTQFFCGPGGYISKLLLMMNSALSGISDTNKRKWLMRANLTTFLILLSLLQVSASSLAQKVTLKENNVSLLKVFREIRKQTGYDVLVDNTDFKTSKKINANFVDAPLERVMDLVVQGTGLTYVIEDKTVVIKEKSLLDKVKAYLENIDVTGKVVDEKGEPVAGATIKVKGSSIVTSSNGNGVFALKNVSEDAVLEISYLGYQAREMKVAKDLGSVRMEVAVGKLEEVTVNAGYYTVKDEERTGSISKVTSDIIQKQPINNPLMALQGRVTGLQIIQNSSVPGGGFTVRIRGQNSISSGNDPFYVIDGVPYPAKAISGSFTGGIFGPGGSNPLSMINPNDIESVEILKDADATAIYGSRGANGVILITTKRGSENSKINILISHGVSSISRPFDLLNTREYVEMRKEALKNDGLQPGSTEYDINGIWSLDKNTDWQKLLIGKVAPTTNVSLNIGNGTAKSNYLLSGNYYSEGTVFPGDFGFQRLSLRSSINLGSTKDRFSVNFTFGFNHTNSRLIANDLTSSVFLPPNAPNPYDDNGNLNWSNNTFPENPMAKLLQTNNAKTDNLLGNVILNYRILQNLHFKTSLGYSTIRRQELLKFPLASQPPTVTAPERRESYFGNNYDNNLIAEPQLTYKAKVGKGEVDMLVGMSLQDNSSNLGVIKASNFSSDDLMENIGSAGTIINNESAFTQYRYIAFFSRFNYNLFEKYLVNLTARRDGSSRFGSGKQFANFGAIGAAWVFSKESGFKEFLPFISFGKLRASYGTTGNDQILNYGYLELWNTSFNYQGNSTVIPSTSGPNADFAWETNRKLEAAIQLGLFKDRLNLEISYYRNRSSNQLLSKSLPLSTGLNGVIFNLPAEIQNKGLEFNIDMKVINSKNWGWSANVNLTNPKNKLLAYEGLEKSSNASFFQVGQPLNILKTYNVNVNKQTGIYTFEDYNNNGRTDDGDRYLTKFLGAYFYGGLQNSVRFKQFTLDVQFSFTKQNGRSYMLRTGSPGFWISRVNSNQFTTVLDRWQQQGDETSIQKYSSTLANRTLYNLANTFGNISVVDASYVTLRNVSIAWSLPKTFLSRMKINSAAFTLQGQNLLTLTNYIGLNPETQTNLLPPLRNLSLGATVTF
jgi:TonB-linked SusC/RagA family outer membrane protein